MRIITGKARGVKLATLPGEDTRPTAERVKEAVFSAIQFETAGRVVLDLFGGSGQMALEALSRGAARAVVVDVSKKAADVIRANAIKTGLFDDCRVICADWRDFLRSASGKGAFSLVFLDPPYKPLFLDEVIKRALAADIITKDAIIVCESAEDSIPAPVDGFVSRLYKYGKVYVTVLRAEEGTD